MRRAIFDTNVFIAAGFRRDSASAPLIAEVADRRLMLVWSPQTREETKTVLSRIPKLSWKSVADLFEEAGLFDTPLDLEPVSFVQDVSDRKFAALALASGAPLVSSDDDLLTHRGRLNVWTPGAFLRAQPGAEEEEA